MRYVTLSGMTLSLNDATVGLLVDGILVERATAVLPQSTTAPIFTVVGRVALLNLIGEVTTVMTGTASNLKAQSNPTVTGASVDLCANVAVASAAVGTLFAITGTLADAMQKALAVLGMGPGKSLILQAGTIDLVTDGSNATGSIKWTAAYIPLSEGAMIVVA
jgi:hypothetical protein